MEDTETFQRVAEIIGDKLGHTPGNIEGYITLEELGADSLDIIELAMELEEAFNVSISNAMAREHFTTVHQVSNLVQQLVEETAAAEQAAAATKPRRGLRAPSGMLGALRPSA